MSVNVHYVNLCPGSGADDCIPVKCHYPAAASRSPPTVLQISRRVEYALRAVMKLAVSSQGTLLSFKDIANCEDIPRDYLAKILRSLVDAELISSRRGANGGYKLAKPVDEITFLDVMEAADSAIAINLCTQNGDGCVRTSECSMAQVWQRAEDAMREVLRGTTIADVLTVEQASLSDGNPANPASATAQLQLRDLVPRPAEPLPCEEL